MKLYITPDNIGLQSGGGIVTRNELEALKSLGEDVIVIEGKDINPINYNIPDTPFLQDYLTLEKLYQIDLSKIKIAHFYAGPFTQTIRYLKARGIKTTLTMASHNREESIKEFQNLGLDYPFNHVKDEKLWKIYNGAVHDADIVICPSKLSKDFLIKEGVKEEKIEIIPHGVNIPDKVEPIPSQFNIGYLGQTGPDKGLRYLIQAWSELGYKDSTLIFAGRGTESLGSFINKYATNGRFHLMGYVKDIADFYNNISVYVQPSTTEAWGIEVIEAMSHGRPVIVSNGAGAEDAVTEGVDGFIVDKRDIKDLVDKIDWFKNHPKELIEMGENAREKSKQYSWDKIRQQYTDLWKELQLILTNDTYTLV